MGTPLQIWQPNFHTAPFDETFARDLQRAMGKWRGEDVAWFLPRMKESRWVANHPIKSRLLLQGVSEGKIDCWREKNSGVGSYNMFLDLFLQKNEFSCWLHWGKFIVRYLRCRLLWQIDTCISLSTSSLRRSRVYRYFRLQYMFQKVLHNLSIEKG